MYKEAMEHLSLAHVGTWTRDPDEQVCRAGVFTVLTIQSGLVTVPALIVWSAQCNGTDSVHVWGHKKQAIDWLTGQWGLLDRLVAFYHAGDRAGAQMYIARECPGLGIVKASFMLQLLGFKTSCLDTHNLARLGIGPQQFKFSTATKDETVYKKIALYNELCDASGTSEYWWDTWCAFVAGRGPNKSLATAEAVSQLHVDCIA